MACHPPYLQRVVQQSPLERTTTATSQPYQWTPAAHQNSAADETLTRTWVLFSPTGEDFKPSCLSASNGIVGTQANNLSIEPDEHAWLGDDASFNPTLDDFVDSLGGGNDAIYDGELDSLDSHLVGFRPSVFPSHDGLGSFHVNHIGTILQVQEQIYAHERYNRSARPRHRRPNERRGPSLRDQEPLRSEDKITRVKAWRLEQSQILLGEIERLAWRQAGSQSSTDWSPKAVDEEQLPGSNERIHGSVKEEEPEGFWARVTRTIIKDIMGIDDRLLSILLGEALPEDDEDLWSATANISSKGALRLEKDNSNSTVGATWQLHVLQRVARELGLLVHTLSPRGQSDAHSTYLRVQQAPIPYAGLSTLSEAAFTLTPIGDLKDTPPPNVAPAVFSQDEWERDLDVRLVFKYLRSCFGSRSDYSTASAQGGSIAPREAMAARLARVQQYHPLAATAAAIAATHHQPLQGRAMLKTLHRCASQSSRRSARRSSCSSRRYWDCGSSFAGSRSLIASVGPMDI